VFDLLSLVLESGEALLQVDLPGTGWAPGRRV
jgi:hypothetical protein